MPEAELDEFYEQQRGQVVATITAACGDPDVAEELAQEALVRAWEHWDDVREMDAPGAWLHRVAMNLTHSHYRRRTSRRDLRERLQRPEQWSDETDPALRLTLVRALERLPVRQRAAVTLRYLSDWSVADVAAALNTKPNTVKSLTHRGIKQLRRQFETVDGPPDGDSRRTILVTIVCLLVAGGLTAIALTAVNQPEPGVVIDTPDPDGSNSLPLELPPDGGAAAIVTGDRTEELTLPHLGLGWNTGNVYDTTNNHLNRRFTDRHNSLIIYGSAPHPDTPTGEDLRVSVSLTGGFFDSTDGECTVTITSYNDPFIRPHIPTEGTIHCHGLQRTDADGDVQTIDVTATFHIPAPQRGW